MLVEELVAAGKITCPRCGQPYPGIEGWAEDDFGWHAVLKCPCTSAPAPEKDN